MRLRDTIVYFVCLILIVVLLIIAGSRLDYINSQRKEMKLIINEPLENAPPSLAFATVAMGAFRGLVVDALWIRADNLKEQGQFFDAKQLAEWITVLQPRFAAVWEFQAWNMAYNISVAIPATQPDQRWRWVKNGYELLRDKGIPLNPKSIELYRELARIFQHKIGGVTDDDHRYYKVQLALTMEPLLGPADNEYFEALAKAPIKWQQIIENKDVADLISALGAAGDVFAGADDGRFVDNYLALRQNPKRFKPSAIEIIDNFRGTPALEKFDIFAKAYYLRTGLKLDPVLMQQLNKTYGPIEFSDPNKHVPLDWRHPDSHALYWGVKGLKEVAKDENREVSITETNTDRIVVHSLQNLFRYGKIFLYDVPVESPEDSSISAEGGEQRMEKRIYLRPDLRMFKPYNDAMLAVLDKYKRPDDEGSYKSLQDGHRNMMKNAIFLFYQTGHVSEAQKIYDQLRKRYPLEEFKVPLSVFAINRFREELRDSLGIFDAREQIIALLRESYFRYAMRDDDAASGSEKLAQEIWQRYQEEYPEENRVDLAKLPVLRYLALLDFINDEQYPLNLRLNLLGRIKIEKPELYKEFEQYVEQLRKKAETVE
jgi:hypothetical protein